MAGVLIKAGVFLYFMWKWFKSDWSSQIEFEAGELFFLLMALLAGLMLAPPWWSN